MCCVFLQFTLGVFGSQEIAISPLGSRSVLASAEL